MSRKSWSWRRPFGKTQLHLEQLEARELLSGPGASQPDFPEMPADTAPLDTAVQGQENTGVLWYGAPKEVTIKIVNNTEQTVYPILRNANSNIVKTGPNTGKGLYDPYDNPNEEYRAYVGYHVGEGTDKKWYLGLKSGASITFQVPLVFWDAGRLNIATDGTYLTPRQSSPTDEKTPNPFFYYDYNKEDNTPTRINHVDTTDGTNGSVMFYHWRDKPSVDPHDATVIVKSKDFGPDAPYQLTEYTIRHPFQGDVSFPTHDDLPASEKPPLLRDGLINYDVSYVDSILLPVAMAADPVPIPVDPVNYKGPIPDPKAFAWIGAAMTQEQMQTAIKAFVSTNTAGHNENGLGNYFGGKGYPAYFIPSTPQVLAGVKLPAGQNLFLSSPENGPPNGVGPLSNYSKPGVDDEFLLTSADVGNIKVGGTGKAETGNLRVVKFTDPGDFDKLKNAGVKKGWTVSGLTAPGGQTAITGKATTGNLNVITVDNPDEVKKLQAANVGPGWKVEGQTAGPTPQSIVTAGTTVASISFANGIATITLGPSGDNQAIDDALHTFVFKDPAPIDPTPKPIVPAGTTVEDISFDGGVVTVTLGPGADNKAINDGLLSFNFSRPIQDYVADALTDLWFGWANYYASNHQQFATVSIDDGNIQNKQRELRFPSTAEADVKKLAVGTKVTGAGLPQSLQASIMDIVQDDKTKEWVVKLNKLAGSLGSGKYEFAAPEYFKINAADANYPLLKFTGALPPTANAFAESIYKVMAAMNTIPDDPADRPHALLLMANVIGGNIGKIPNIGNYNIKNPTDPGNDAIPNEVRDAVKSVLRGVPNFLLPEFSDDSTWYPKPDVPTPGAQIQHADGTTTVADFNVLNLNPFVYFVHKTLGLSGYGFSLDDDVADVGAPSARHLVVSIGGIKDAQGTKTLNQQAEWKPGAPYGPVEIEGTIVPNPDDGGRLTRITVNDYTKLVQVFGKTPLGPGAFVTFPTAGVIEEGTRILQVALDPAHPNDPTNWIILDKPAKSTASGKFTFVGEIKTNLESNNQESSTFFSQVLQVASEHLTVVEGNTIQVPIKRLGSSRGTVTAGYNISLPGSNQATPGQDFQNVLSGFVTFLDGEIEKIISIPLNDDNLVENLESLIVSLANVTGGATLDEQKTAEVGILDNDLPTVADATPNLPALQKVAATFGKTAEHYTTFVTTAYNRFLNRQPETQGLNYWVTLMQLYETSNHTQGLSQSQVEAGFLSAQEYQNRFGGANEAWLRGVYHDLLGRDADQNGLQYWLAQLKAGMSTNSIALGFTTSDEWLTDRVTALYNDFLGRAPETFGLNYWVNVLKAGGTTEDLNTGFVGSIEYYNNPQGADGNPAVWIQKAYLDILFRPPTVEELNTSLVQLRE